MRLAVVVVVLLVILSSSDPTIAIRRRLAMLLPRFRAIRLRAVFFSGHKSRICLGRSLSQRGRYQSQPSYYVFSTSIDKAQQNDR
jgi:hypothetical protein